MAFRWRGGWLARLSRAGIVLHLLVVLFAPFEHNDLLGHLRQSQHCTACLASPASPDPQPIAVIGAWTPRDLGQAVQNVRTSKDVLLAVHTAGRSPPLS